MPACDDYVEAYRGCLSRASGGRADDVVERRVELTRSTLTASATDAPARARLSATCESGLEQLKEACR